MDDKERSGLQGRGAIPLLYSRIGIVCMNCGVLDEDIVMSGCVETDEDSFDMDKDTFEIKQLELCALEQVLDMQGSISRAVPRCA